ncbi:FAD-binding monooxygenase [Streptomyces lucensis JCM 4490]|uniref:FAD-binding monooxygenase n=2 Tax=Streptomyces lucensis TaxID=67319 RepID=A0A918J9U8_9ACTN|nr:FAD-binding monooxygenase [Streptomyces lucensis JCM 4490]
MESDGTDSAGQGAPHRSQLHALLSMGETQLNRWFPGITEDLIRHGAQVGSGPAIQYYVDGVLKACVPDSMMLGATRPFLEDHMRQRVVALPNVQVRAARATGLLFTGSRVCGVRFQPRDSVTLCSGNEELDADLVVDAMGRSSRLGTWLREHGWDEPPLDRMRVDLGYATALFHRGQELPGTVIAHASPGPSTGYEQRLSEPGALTAVEANRWSVVIAGYGEYKPDRDPVEFLRRMRRCVAPLREVAGNCELDGDIQTFHFRESRRRNFTRLNRFPGGLLAVGDAVASVNPAYGQGLTLATLAASSLSAHLRAGASPRVPAWNYFRRLGVVVNAAWQVSTTADLAQPHVTGPYPRGYRMIRWAGDKVLEASVIDTAVNAEFMAVVNMHKHPRALAKPRTLLRAARVLATRR